MGGETLARWAVACGLLLLSVSASAFAKAEPTEAQQIEKSFKVKIQEGVTVDSYSSYESITQPETSADYLSMLAKDSCLVAVSWKKWTYGCYEHHASSDILGGLIFLGTLGNLGSANGSYQDSTYCTADYNVELLIRRDWPGSGPRLERERIGIEGSASVDKIKWIKYGLKKRARQEAAPLITSFQEALKNMPTCTGWGVTPK
ncbi:MAG TPA: hypothetical protein VL588_06425 [Bdellovibrionota bacterium]|jgi:hypothetical protein|nr:hypothetical protein [Bdellovibrionota bacterium]